MRCNSLPRLFRAPFFCLCLLGIALQAIPAAAQGPLRDRITAAVSSNSAVAIPDTVHPRVKLGTDLGPTPADTKLEMSIRFNLTAAQQAALDQLLADQQNPSSPRYHQWLTPAQYAAQFGLSSADIAQVSTWLTSQGFTVTGVANGGSFITFTGSVGQAQSAFSTSIHNLSVNGETHFANITNIQLPSAIAGVVTTVTGLHNFRLKPRAHTSVVNPQYTDSSTGDHYLAPGDIDTIYDVKPLQNSGYTGTGMTIAVTGQVDIYTTDIAAFRTASGLSAINLTTVHAAGVDPGPPECNSCTYEANEGDLEESSIDVEWSGAMAPAANILFVNALCALPGTGCGTDAITDAIDSDLAPIVTTSYGNCEAGWGTADLISTNALFKQASAQGQTILAAAADQGATDCDGGPIAQYGLAVDFPGSSPYVTSMGGTQFNEGTATGTTQYWNSNSSSGTANAGSAISYIPEAVWNNESALGDYVFEGGGGGPSAFFTKPAWQVGTPADAARDVPDLSLSASNYHDSFLYCVNVAPAEGAESCTSGFSVPSGTFAGLNVAGGTSFDSQIFGGMLAVLEQKLGTTGGLGNINPKLYAFGNNATYYTPGATIATNTSVVFNDITNGNNAMPCTAGTIDCGNGGSIGFNAGNGYDEASGWGSVNLNNLATDWNLVAPLSSGSIASYVSTTTLTANGSSTGATVTSGATVTLTATVSGGSGAAPTGTVVFLANNVAIGSISPLTTVNSTESTATFTWTTSCTNLGQQDITASYSGDSNYQGSIATSFSANGETAPTPVEVQVNTNTCPDFSLAASGTGVTASGSNGSVAVAAGGSIPGVVITATPLNGFTGTITFTATVTSTTGYVPTLNFNPTSVTLPSGTQSTTLTFTGITADLRLPAAPGKVDSGTMLARHNSGKTPWYAAGSGITIASLLLFTLPRKRRLGGLLLLVLSVALIGAVSGCGSSSQSGPPSSSGNSNSEAGIYTVTVTGTFTSGSHTTTHTSIVTYTIN